MVCVGVCAVCCCAGVLVWAIIDIGVVSSNAAIAVSFQISLHEVDEGERRRIRRKRREGEGNEKNENATTLELIKRGFTIQKHWIAEKCVRGKQPTSIPVMLCCAVRCSHTA